MDVSLLVAIVAVGMAALTFADRMLAKTLSIREHEEFKRATDAQIKQLFERQEVRLPIKDHDDWRQQFRREVDMLREELRLLQAKVPTTGELGVITKNLESRLDRLEEQLRAYRQ